MTTALRSALAEARPYVEHVAETDAGSGADQALAKLDKALAETASVIAWREIPKNLYALVDIKTPLLVSWFMEAGDTRVAFVSYARDGLAALSYRNLYAIADAPEPAPITPPTTKDT